jgi:hypothetical protein
MVPKAYEIVSSVETKRTQPNYGVQLTASRCDVKVTSMEWPVWPR